MKNRLLTVAGALALLVVLGKFYAKPLLAQVRAALVANIDEPARAPYQVLFDGTCDLSNCFLRTQPVPANKRLHVTHISTSMAVNFSMLVTREPAGVEPVYVFPTAGGGRFSVNQNVDFYLEAGDTLETIFFPNIVSGLGALKSTVTGYLVDCTVAACAATVSQ